MKVDIPSYDEIDTIGEQIIIHKWDTWSMDHTLAKIVLPMLKQLKATKHGAPNVDAEDVPVNLRPSEEWIKRYNHDGETDPYFFKRWEYVLDEMIFAFETKEGVLKDWEEQFYESETVTKYEPVGIGPAQLRLFPDEDGSLEDYQFYEMKFSGESKVDWDGRKAYQERISNGFRLFGKYYESLWD